MSLDRAFVQGAFDELRRMMGPPQIPRYAVAGLLGEGGMAVVYRAHDRELDRPVALKVLKHAGEEARERFQREARAAAALAHPNVVAIHDSGEFDGRPYLVLELVEGRPLSALFAEGVDRARLVRILAQAARGVAAAHARGIVHRDLKPANLLVGADDSTKVADFGLAWAAEFSHRLTASGSSVGTPLYMAPEQVQGGAVTARTDVHALGAILYEGLAGRPPFTAANLVELHAQIAHEKPPAPATASAELRLVCARAMEKDPALRFAEAGELADELERIAEGRPILTRAPGAWQALRRRVRPGVRAAVAAAAVLASAAWFGSAWLQSRQDRALARNFLAERFRAVREAVAHRKEAGQESAALATALSEAEALAADGRLVDATVRLDGAVARLTVEDLLRQALHAVDEARAQGRDEPGLLAAIATAQEQVQAGRWPEAAEALQRALATRPPPQPSPADAERIQGKIGRVQAGLERWRRAGREIAPLASRVQEAGQNLERGRVREAETILDEVLRRLEQ